MTNSFEKYGGWCFHFKQITMMAINFSYIFLSLSIVGVSVHGLVQIADDGQELRIQNLDLSYEFKNIQVPTVNSN